MNQLLGPLLLLPLVAGTPSGILASEPPLEVLSREFASVSTLLGSTPSSLDSPVDVDEDIELNREADDRLKDGQKPIRISITELASVQSLYEFNVHVV